MCLNLDNLAAQSIQTAPTRPVVRTVAAASCMSTGWRVYNRFRLPREATVRKVSASLHHRSTDSDCSPYGLVCENGDCTNPPPCGPNNTCPEGEVCATNYDPPACLPEGAGQCSRDEQCPADQYVTFSAQMRARLSPRQLSSRTVL